MGVPKFFRWLSERYPLINQTIDFQNVGPIFGMLTKIDNLSWRRSWNCNEFIRHRRFSLTLTLSQIIFTWIWTASSITALTLMTAKWSISPKRRWWLIFFVTSRICSTLWNPEKLFSWLSMVNIVYYRDWYDLFFSEFLFFSSFARFQRFSLNDVASSIIVNSIL